MYIVCVLFISYTYVCITSFVFIMHIISHVYVVYIIYDYNVLLYTITIIYVLYSRGKYAEITLDTCARCGSGKCIMYHTCYC